MNLADATILIVDDEPELLEIFAIWLKRSGCKVLTAVNGAEALKVLAANKVDALVSDIRMPIMDGVSLVRRIYELKLQIPSIIFVSGFGDIDIREVHSLGVEATLSKPLNRHQLLHVLECSLKTPHELWLEESPTPAVQQVTVDVDSVECDNHCDFALGRGGCCFKSTSQLTPERTIDLTINFAREALTLKAQGMVRWYDSNDGHAGVAFLYLDPDCREWVIQKMTPEVRFSFIPRC